MGNDNIPQPDWERSLLSRIDRRLPVCLPFKLIYRLLPLKLAEAAFVCYFDAWEVERAAGIHRRYYNLPLYLFASRIIAAFATDRLIEWARGRGPYEPTPTYAHAHLDTPWERFLTYAMPMAATVIEGGLLTWAVAAHPSPAGPPPVVMLYGLTFAGLLIVSHIAHVRGEYLLLAMLSVVFSGLLGMAGIVLPVLGLALRCVGLSLPGWVILPAMAVGAVCNVQRKLGVFR